MIDSAEARRRKNRPRDELIKASNCADIGCPAGKEKGFCCKEISCASAYGWFKPGEIVERFNAQQIRQIVNAWNDITGYLDPTGCRLAAIWRGLMSDYCLRSLCYPRPVRGK